MENLNSSPPLGVGLLFAHTVSTVVLSKKAGDPMTKQCTRCKVVKSLDEFYPRGKNAWRPACKSCSSAQAKEYAQGHRYQGPPTETIPVGIRVASYRSVIHRMVGYGLMSESTAQESLKRVDELERVGQ